MPRSAMWRPTYLVLRKLPIAATCTAREKNSALSSSTPLPPSSAALLTKMSICPELVDHPAARKPITCCSSVTSPGTAMGPCLRCARSCPPQAFAAGGIDVVAGHRRAVAGEGHAIPLPMLGPAPVTRATLPSSEISTCAPVSCVSDVGRGGGRAQHPRSKGATGRRPPPSLRLRWALGAPRARETPRAAATTAGTRRRASALLPASTTVRDAVTVSVSSLTGAATDTADSDMWPSEMACPHRRMRSSSARSAVGSTSVREV